MSVLHRYGSDLKRMTYRNGFCVLSKLEALSVLAVLDKRCTRHENSTLKGGFLKIVPPRNATSSVQCCHLRRILVIRRSEWKQAPMPDDRKRDKKTILESLRRHSGQRTVLYVALAILAEHRKALDARHDCDGLAERDVVIVFRDLARKYGHSDYHPTYIHRRLGHRGFLELSGSKYRFRSALMTGVTAAQLDDLRDELVLSLKTAFERRQAVIRQLEQTVSLPHHKIQERRDLVASYLGQIVGNGGETFEVVSFAILREYFRTFGFSLQRFSTTHANDGGMDFVAGEAIYQVTADESANKVRRDLAKSPGTKRVLVRPTVSDEIIRLCDAEVLETIELKDLLDHFIAWLLARDTRSQTSRHLQQVLQIALHEFRRENKAESEVA